ncbi:uncharacterized protein F4807DRAFT_429979 [Annulohypoxylon truncatum]|uniref:uncharacterized protein n=1 Tax=Annulohypoxylon truncatum TaxID=327061 RepID=UPI002008DB69|nr:uncharacterized protein F4807DRAFT_429979 [Annulohypoxylon truncatum]KAI1208535.1 hypothetical protein F4807DRAFT_429979 [Annulohypoxylon truncatum]
MQGAMKNSEPQTPLAEAAIVDQVETQTLGTRIKPKKPFSFYMLILSLWLVVIITSWDATCLAMALPPQGTASISRRDRLGYRPWKYIRTCFRRFVQRTC